MTSKSFTQITADLSKALAALRKDIPETSAAFTQLSREAMKAGALSELHKELIALGIGIASRCDGCIGYHVRTLVKLGVTREQFVETLGVAIYMGGGPSLMYAAESLRAYEEFAAVAVPH